MGEVCSGAMPHTSMTGVTELQQCERTKDAWLRNIQDEFRFGKLTEETHAFLHGAPTMKPSSIVNGNIMCARKKKHGKIFRRSTSLTLQ